MQLNEFHRPFSVDFAPQGSLCEWCGNLAERQLTAIGGTFHNEGGLFCRTCGEEFAQGIVASLKVPVPVTANGARENL